ncbi:MAG: OsmC family protein [Bacteroidetes bacterium]|nr:OsmC family protein [Bacteroidota bacterium]
MSALEANVTLVNDRMQFRGALRDNPPITMDYIPPLGDGDGYMPMELVLMSLGTCSGSSVAALLRRMGRTVSALDVRASGVRREQHPTSFETIALDFTLTSPDATEEDMGKALKLSEDSICPVWDMLKGRVTITTGFDIIR